MSVRTYARRRVNPYRGVVHILDLGEAMAHTDDGLTWHLRAEDGQGLMRPVGVWVEDEGVSAGTRIPGELIAALRQHPPLPFMLADRMELWLLDKQRGLPLALLASELPSRFRHERIKPEWHPFTLSHTGFYFAALARREERTGTSGGRHRDWLARMVNSAAQWFHRQPGGSGEGLRPANGGIMAVAHTARAGIPSYWCGRPGITYWNSRLLRNIIPTWHPCSCCCPI